MTDDAGRRSVDGDVGLDLYIEDGEVVIAGPTEAALAYVEQLRGAGAQVSTSMLSGRRAADAAAALAVADGVRRAAQGGVYMQVAKESLPHLAREGLIPAKNGAHTYLGMTRSGSKIAHHVRFIGKPVNPAQLVNVQMLAVQFALRMAIAEVVSAVKRVEGKVDALLKLARADQVGNVLGLHEMLTHYCHLLDESGVVTTSDWNAVAAVGSQLSVTMNQLRKHVSNALAEVVVSAPINQRADAVSALVNSHRIDETLNLLVVVEDAMFKFQQLRVAHVQRTEPEFLESTVLSARQILADSARLDEELYTSVNATLSAASVVRPLEIHRVISTNKLEESAEVLKNALDEFSRARQLQAVGWHEAERPTLGEAAGELGKRIQATAQRIDAAGDRAVDSSFSRLGALGRALQSAADRRLDTGGSAESEGGPDSIETQVKVDTPKEMSEPTSSAHYPGGNPLRGN